MNTQKKWTAAIILTAGIVMGVVIASRLDLTPAALSNINVQPSLPLVATTDWTQAVEEVASIVGPAVVSIQTERVEHYQMRRQFFGSPFEDDLFNKFFEDFFGAFPENEMKRSGLGSGVIIDHRGYILTNEHVIADADKITVVLPDGRECEGTLKGTDPRSDLAIVKIDAADLPAARLGESTDLKIGQWVVAIGNPFGHLLQDAEPTVTVGVISALQRSLPRTSRRDTNYTGLIQTDAAINPGNSGGPLVNLQGEVVGINVAIFSTSGGYQGIGFAIPITTAKRIIDDLIEGREVEYGWVGVNIQNLDQRLADYFNLPNTNGVLVANVVEGSPAEQAGIREDDVILEIDGKKIKDTTEMLNIVGSVPVGKKVALGVLRDGKKSTISVLAGKRPYFDEEGNIIEKKEPTQSQPQAQDAQQWRGAEVENIDPALAQQFRLDTTDGVIIKSIENNSATQEAGLRKGDIIIKINKTPITSIADFITATEKATGDCLVRTVRGYFVVKK